jgi:hypothetical protein
LWSNAQPRHAQVSTKGEATEEVSIDPTRRYRICHDAGDIF